MLLNKKEADFQPPFYCFLRGSVCFLSLSFLFAAILCIVISVLGVMMLVAGVMRCPIILVCGYNVMHRSYHRAYLRKRIKTDRCTYYELHNGEVDSSQGS